MTGEEIFSRLQKPGKAVKVSKPIKQVGKVTKQRQADKKAKLKAEPADHAGRRVCYICLQLRDKPVLEHVLDSSVRPDLRSNPVNHKWADADCNIRKKNGTLTPTEMARVERAVQDVLAAVDSIQR